MYVKKFDGSKQEFDKNRIINTCLRNGASQETAKEIANRIEKEIYDGTTTKDILRLIWKHLTTRYPESRSRVDLRSALSLLKSKPDFEKYVSLILENLGYAVQSNVTLKGRCVEHEIDAIAKKAGETLYVEIKHHDLAHTYTPLDVPMKVWATLQDLIEGRKLGYHNVYFTNALILCNTKFTDHARKYADCMGIDHIGWKSRGANGLEAIIEQGHLYPITMLKEVDRRLQRLFVDNGILLLLQLTKKDAEILTDKRIISPSQLSSLRNKALKLLNP